MLSMLYFNFGCQNYIYFSISYNYCAKKEGEPLKIHPLKELKSTVITSLQFPQLA